MNIKAAEIWECIKRTQQPRCSIYDGQYYEGKRAFITIPNGQTLTLPGVGRFPLWSEIMLCEEHAKADRIEY